MRFKLPTQTTYHAIAGSIRLRAWNLYWATVPENRVYREILACYELKNPWLVNKILQLKFTASKMSALHIAVKKGVGFHFVIPILIRDGAQVDARDVKQRTALHYAARYGAVNAIRYLLDAGADINALTNQSQTPLQLAAERGHYMAVKLLCERGADISHQSLVSTLTAQDYALKFKHEAVAGYLLLQNKTQQWLQRSGSIQSDPTYITEKAESTTCTEVGSSASKNDGVFDKLTLAMYKLSLSDYNKYIAERYTLNPGNFIWYLQAKFMNAFKVTFLTFISEDDLANTTIYCERLKENIQAPEFFDIELVYFLEIDNYWMNNTLENAPSVFLKDWDMKHNNPVTLPDGTTFANYTDYAHGVARNLKKYFKDELISELDDIISRTTRDREWILESGKTYTPTLRDFYWSSQTQNISNQISSDQYHSKALISKLT